MGLRIAPLALALALVARAAAAQPSADEARAQASALQAEGHRLLLQHEDAAALEKFQAAYHLVPSPKILFNMGRAYQRLGQDAEAYDAFDRFLTDARDVPPESRAQAERSRAEVRPRVALVEIVAPAGDDLSVDGQKVGRTPLARPLALPAGTRVFRLEHDGTVLSEKAVPVLAGAVTRFVIDVTAAPAPPAPTLLVAPPRPMAPPAAIERPPPPPERPVYGRWWFWTAIAVAAGAAVAGAAAGGAFRHRNASCPMEWQCP